MSVIYGNTKIAGSALTTNSKTVTDEGIALDASENNPNIEGSLRYNIDHIQSGTSLDGLTYSTQGLTILSNRCSIQSGGYVKVGNLVIVNLSINVTYSSADSAYISGFPIPLDNTTNYVCGVANSAGSAKVAWVNLNGELFITPAPSTGVVNLAITYLCK